VLTPMTIRIRNSSTRPGIDLIIIIIIHSVLNFHHQCTDNNNNAPHEEERSVKCTTFRENDKPP
jgi:hypothetical protein